MKYNVAESVEPRRRDGGGGTEYHEPLRRALQGLDSGKPLMLVLRSFFTSEEARHPISGKPPTGVLEAERVETAAPRIRRKMP